MLAGKHRGDAPYHSCFSRGLRGRSWPVVDRIPPRSNLRVGPRLSVWRRSIHLIAFFSVLAGRVPREDTTERSGLFVACEGVSGTRLTPMGIPSATPRLPHKQYPL